MLSRDPSLTLKVTNGGTVILSEAKNLNKPKAQTLAIAQVRVFEISRHGQPARVVKHASHEVR